LLSSQSTNSTKIANKESDEHLTPEGHRDRGTQIEREREGERESVGERKKERFCGVSESERL
jgi:hypothetical protein